VAPAAGYRAKHPGEVFWFFFSKKNIFPSLASPCLALSQNKPAAFIVLPSASR
jgi:hypothetical protein